MKADVVAMSSKNISSVVLPLSAEVGDLARHGSRLLVEFAACRQFGLGLSVRDVPASAGSRALDVRRPGPDVARQCSNSWRWPLR